MVMDYTTGDALTGKGRSTFENARNRAICGFGVAKGLAVSERGAGANMSVDVAIGCFIDGTSTFRDITTVQNLAIGAAHATLNRYDIIVGDAAATVSVVAGTAAALPQVPALPANKTLIAIVLVAATVTEIYNADITDSRFFTMHTGLLQATGFGGNGSDGALTVAAGTTTIEYGREFNYSSISISAGAFLTMTGTNSNMDNEYYSRRATPMVLRCSGNCTISGEITLDYLGPCSAVVNTYAGEGLVRVGSLVARAPAGILTPAKVTITADFAGFSQVSGGAGTSTAGAGGGGGCGGSLFGRTGTSGSVGGGSGGAGGATASTRQSQGGRWLVCPGTGGGSTAAESSTAYAGAGGGCLYLEVAGNLTFDGTINARGGAGKAADGATNRGGCGGGGGGSVLILVKGTIANTGTVTVTAGAGGAGDGTGSAGGAGGAGQSLVGHAQQYIPFL